MSSSLHKMVCSHCDTVEHFASVPLEWRCDACDYMNGYNNKSLVSREEIKFSGGKYIPTQEAPTNDAGEKLQSTEETLKERGNRYGDFSNHAKLSQSMKIIFHDHVAKHGRPDLFNHELVESVDMIFHKLARIANGDPIYDDNWRDIAGYAELVVKELNKQKEINEETYTTTVRSSHE